MLSTFYVAGSLLSLFILYGLFLSEDRSYRQRVVQTILSIYSLATLLSSTSYFGLIEIVENTELVMNITVVCSSFILFIIWANENWYDKAIKLFLLISFFVSISGFIMPEEKKAEISKEISKENEAETEDEEYEDE